MADNPIDPDPITSGASFIATWAARRRLLNRRRWRPRRDTKLTREFRDDDLGDIFGQEEVFAESTWAFAGSGQLLFCPLAVDRTGRELTRVPGGILRWVFGP